MKIPSLLRPLASRFVTSFGFLLLLATTARATWSIVVVDRSTGEVCVATATCLSGLDISRYVPVIVVGQGAAAAQSYVDTTGQNRVMIRDGFLAGDDPAQILADLAAADGSHHTRQYGIVSLHGGPPVGFSGSAAGVAKLDVVGEQGSLRYAIQGNVLAGQDVILQTEQTLLNTSGSVVERVMAAMETARVWGGDGRCSCSNSAPTSCGCPPPSFTHSAYTACIVVARVGDTDGNCGSGGCAKGEYYLKEVVVGGAFHDDPVIVLARRVGLWRKNLSGFPDHFRSEALPQATRLPADGATGTQVDLVLRDIDGVPVPHAGQSVGVLDVTEGGPLVTVGSITDNGDGTFAFSLTAKNTPGTARIQIGVTQDNKWVQLYPDLEIELDPPSELHVGHSEISATAGALVPFKVDLGTGSAGQPYLLLLGNSGTQPGTPYGGLTIPLNNDRFLEWSLLAPTVPYWRSNHGSLTAAGWAKSLLTIDPGVFTPYVGSRFDFCVLLPGYVTGPVGLDVVP